MNTNFSVTSNPSLLSSSFYPMQVPATILQTTAAFTQDVSSADKFNTRDFGSTGIFAGPYRAITNYTDNLFQADSPFDPSTKLRADRLRANNLGNLPLMVIPSRVSAQLALSGGLLVAGSDSGISYRAIEGGFGDDDKVNGTKKDGDHDLDAYEEPMGVGSPEASYIDEDNNVCVNCWEEGIPPGYADEMLAADLSTVSLPKRPEPIDIGDNAAPIKILDHKDGTKGGANLVARYLIFNALMVNSAAGTLVKVITVLRTVNEYMIEPVTTLEGFKKMITKCIGYEQWLDDRGEAVFRMLFSGQLMDFAYALRDAGRVKDAEALFSLIADIDTPFPSTEKDGTPIIDGTDEPYWTYRDKTAEGMHTEEEGSMDGTFLGGLPPATTPDMNSEEKNLAAILQHGNLLVKRDSIPAAHDRYDEALKLAIKLSDFKTFTRLETKINLLNLYNLVSLVVTQDANLSGTKSLLLSNIINTIPGLDDGSADTETVIRLHTAAEQFINAVKEER